MKKIVSACFLLIAACPLSSWAEWTGDSSVDYYSDRVISDLHFGQYLSRPYFCIKAVKKSGEGPPIIACALSNQPRWFVSFNAMLVQARYFYTTGKLIRVYVEPMVWVDKSFVKALSSNVLVGLSSCNTSNTSECFGPMKPKR
ncbi:subtilase cytotoxin subunit B [Salmonella enterica subsp. enterica]|nr:subtilase cytotoxin subunit B [Salmonella enterica subsp. enterica]